MPRCVIHTLQNVAYGGCPQVGDHGDELRVEEAAGETLATRNGVELGVDAGRQVERGHGKARVDAAVRPVLQGQRDTHGYERAQCLVAPLPVGVRFDLGRVHPPQRSVGRPGVLHTHLVLDALDQEPALCHVGPDQRQYGALPAGRHLEASEMTKEEQGGVVPVVEPCVELARGQSAGCQRDTEDGPLGSGDLGGEFRRCHGFEAGTGEAYVEGVAVDLPDRGESPERGQPDAEPAGAFGVGCLAAEPGHAEREDIGQVQAGSVVGDQQMVGAQQDAQLLGSRVVGVLDELRQDLKPVGRERLGSVQCAFGHLAVDPAAAAQPLIEQPDSACGLGGGRHVHVDRCVRIFQKRVYRGCESIHVRTPLHWRL